MPKQKLTGGPPRLGRRVRHVGRLHLHQVAVRVRRVVGEFRDLGWWPARRGSWGWRRVARRAGAAGVAQPRAGGPARTRALLRDHAVLVAARVAGRRTQGAVALLLLLLLLLLLTLLVALGAARHHRGALRGHRQRRFRPALHRRQGLLHRLLANLCKINRVNPVISENFSNFVGL